MGSKWVQYICFIKWTFQGLAINEFSGETFSCEDAPGFSSRINTASGRISSRIYRQVAIQEPRNLPSLIDYEDEYINNNGKLMNNMFTTTMNSTSPITSAFTSITTTNTYTNLPTNNHQQELYEIIAQTSCQPTGDVVLKRLSFQVSVFYFILFFNVIS